MCKIGFLLSWLLVHMVQSDVFQNHSRINVSGTCDNESEKSDRPGHGSDQGSGFDPLIRLAQKNIRNNLNSPIPSGTSDPIENAKNVLRATTATGTHRLSLQEFDALFVLYRAFSSGLIFIGTHIHRDWTTTHSTNYRTDYHGFIKHKNFTSYHQTLKLKMMYSMLVHDFQLFVDPMGGWKMPPYDKTLPSDLLDRIISSDQQTTAIYHKKIPMHKTIYDVDVTITIHNNWHNDRHNDVDTRLRYNYKWC
jgi:hypothetical protein